MQDVSQLPTLDVSIIHVNPQIPTQLTNDYSAFHNIGQCRCSRDRYAAQAFVSAQILNVIAST